MSDLSLQNLRALAVAWTQEIPEGDALDPLTAALIDLGVKSSVATLDEAAIEAAIENAFAAGASRTQIEETVALVSGLGVHSLMATATKILHAARARGLEKEANEPLDEAKQALWNHHVGSDPFWTAFESEVPGFLDAMLRNSPDTFRAFFDYCAVPWKSGTVRAKTKELISMASDATPAHRFAPGFRLHLRNAIELGVGRQRILAALDIAAACPPHSGFGKLGI